MKFWSQTSLFQKKGFLKKNLMSIPSSSIKKTRIQRILFKLPQSWSFKAAIHFLFANGFGFSCFYWITILSHPLFATKPSHKQLGTLRLSLPTQNDHKSFRKTSISSHFRRQRNFIFQYFWFTKLYINCSVLWICRLEAGKGKTKRIKSISFYRLRVRSRGRKLCHLNVLDLFCLRVAVRDFRLQTALTIEVSWRHWLRLMKHTAQPNFAQILSNQERQKRDKLRQYFSSYVRCPVSCPLFLISLWYLALQIYNNYVASQYAHVLIRQKRIIHSFMHDCAGPWRGRVATHPHASEWILQLFILAFFFSFQSQKRRFGNGTKVFSKIVPTDY